MYQEVAAALAPSVIQLPSDNKHEDVVIDKVLDVIMQSWHRTDRLYTDSLGAKSKMLALQPSAFEAKRMSSIPLLACDSASSLEVEILMISGRVSASR